MKVLISIIGEQPIPNILPVLYLKPDKNIFLYSTTTEKIAEKLGKLLPNSYKEKVEPYDLQNILTKVHQFINQDEQYVFNITGGTKIMSIALYQISTFKKSEFVYLQSEGNKSILYKYKYENDNIVLVKDALPELINVDLYLKAHLPDYSIFEISENQNSGRRYENVVINTLRNNGFEVIANVKPKGEGNKLEIDAVIRLKGTNNVAVAEIKIGDKEEKGPKSGIDQLALAGQREYLGIYTNRFLITSRQLSKHIKELAIAHKMIVVDGIEQNRHNENLTAESQVKLIQKFKEKLS